MEIKYTIIKDKELIKSMLKPHIKVYFSKGNIVLYVLAGVLSYLLIKSAYSWLGWLNIGFIAGLFSSFLTAYRGRLKTDYVTQNLRIEHALNEEGVWTKSTLGESKSNWSAITNIIDTENYLLLRFVNTIHIPIPKEILTPESTAWLKVKISKK